MTEPEATLAVAEPVPGRLRVVLAGELDVSAVARLRPEIDALLARPAEAVVVDLAGVGFLDSSGLAVLLELAQRFGDVGLSGPSAIVRRVIESAGVAAVLPEVEG